MNEWIVLTIKATLKTSVDDDDDDDDDEFRG